MRVRTPFVDWGLEDIDSYSVLREQITQLEQVLKGLTLAS